MVYRQWQNAMGSLGAEGDGRSEAWLARWSGLSPENLSEWDLEPDYGAFVDLDGRIVSGARQREAWLDSSDPRQLQWSADITKIVQSHSGAVPLFLDWGVQSLSWEAIFSAWDQWEAEGEILSCGPVDVSFELGSLWKAPAYIVFRRAFEHGLDGVVLKPVEKAGSLLERAQAIRNATVAPEAPVVAMAEAGDPLPMLPFTLASLNDEEHRWPVGTAGFGA